VRFVNNWRTGDAHQFSLFDLWYIDKKVFGHAVFGFLVFNFGISFD
jgi:hypothetical protein